MTVLPLPFQFGYLLLIFLVWLLRLGLPNLCWIEVVRVGIFVMFLNLSGKHSVFHHWVLCWLLVCHKWLLLYWDLFTLNSSGRVLIMNGCWFCPVLFLRPLRWLCVFCLFFVNMVITLIDLHMLNYPVTLQWIQLDHGVWSFLCIVGFGLLIFFWSFCIYIHQRYWPEILHQRIFLLCSVFVWFWYQGDGGFIEWI